jgi:hypothetical protein
MGGFGFIFWLLILVGVIGESGTGGLAEGHGEVAVEGFDGGAVEEGGLIDEVLPEVQAEEIADGSAYEGRSDLGNTKPGDGKRFKGRGLIQLTGRANYAAYSKDTGVDYVAKPLLVATDPLVAVDVACWFWNKHGISKLADKDDVKAVTKAINGGFNGLDDRIEFLLRAKAVLGI